MTALSCLVLHPTDRSAEIAPDTQQAATKADRRRRDESEAEEKETDKESGSGC